MFDVLTVAALADELGERLIDGRVQQVGMLSRLAVGLEVYSDGRRVYLAASAEHDAPRALLLEREPSFDRQLVTPLLLLLRKYVRGGIIVGIEQPPLERIIRVSIAKRLEPHNASQPPDEFASGGVAEEEDEPDGLEGATFVHLVVEVMGRHSNVILVDDEGRIMEAVKRVTPRMSRVRPIAPKLPYVDPPIGDWDDPRRLSAASAAVVLGSERRETTLATVLPRRLRAVSPQMAREIAYRATGSAQATVADAVSDPGALARETRRLFEPLLTSAWAPTIYRDAGDEVVAYAAVPMEHLARSATPEAAASMSVAVALAEIGDQSETLGKHAQRIARLQAEIREARARLMTRLASLDAETERSAGGERYREWGELIYAYLWAIKPGQTELDADGMKIPLDPQLSPSENAQAYFERYRKSQSAGAHLPELSEQVRTEIAYLDQLDLLAGQTATFQELEDVAAEWEGYRQPRPGAPTQARRPRSTPPRRTRPVLEHHGNAVYVGKSSTENDRIAFEIAGPNDTWLHARGVPGSHVVVRWGNAAGNEDDETLGIAASLAAFYSAGRGNASVEVDITRRRFVRKIKGAGPGMVTYRNERTVSARPRDVEG